MTAGRPPSLAVERALAAAGAEVVLGCDEVGRGAIAGPIVVGVLVKDIGQPAVFGLGAGSFVVAAVLVLTLGVETRGRTLEAISG